MSVEIKHRFTGKVLLVVDGANLEDANLEDADLRRADLGGADLRRANLRGAYLEDADLRRADLRRANLRGADLRRANLVGADLEDADLEDADLRRANLRGANLRGANLEDADLEDAYLPYYMNCPEEGDFIGYKKIQNNTIVKLLITGKRTSSLVGRKCRCSECKVIGIEGDGEYSLHDGQTKYTIGEMIKPDSYNDDIRVECTNGIHFFITRKEAEQY